MTKAVFQLEPLTCPTCVKKIETALTNQAGVDMVKVLFNSSKVKAEFDEKVVEHGELETIIEKLGYTVKGTKVS